MRSVTTSPFELRSTTDSLQYLRTSPLAFHTPLGSVNTISPITKSLGVDGLDTDLPTAFEAVLLDSLLGKAFFCTFQLLFYAIRPMLVYKIHLGPVHYCNIIAQAVIDYLIIRYWGWNAMIYLLLSSLLAGSLHPCAAHFIAEHYVFCPIHSKRSQDAQGCTYPRDILLLWAS